MYLCIAVYTLDDFLTLWKDICKNAFELYFITPAINTLPGKQWKDGQDGFMLERLNSKVKHSIHSKCFWVAFIDAIFIKILNATFKWHLQRKVIFRIH